MDGIYQAWQTGLVWVCLCALGAMAVLLFLAKVAAPAWDAVRRWWSLPCIQRVIVGVCVVGLSYYGATKQGWHVAYDGGIKAGATANVVTNDTVSIYWQRDTSGGVYVPETATVYIDYRPNTETNAEWGLLAQTTVGAWGWSGTVENATNYDYNVWAYYIPPEPVHTNGVWTYKTHFDRSGEYALPLRARVEVNGVAIATPAEKRKDAEKRPYDAEVEYLESTGTQWIDTGCNADSDLSVEITMAVTADTSWSNINPLGAILIEPILRHHLNFNTGINYYFGPESKAIKSGYKPGIGVPFTFKVDAAGKTFSVASFTGALPTDTFDTGMTYWLFARNNNGGTTQSTPLRLRSAKLWKGGVLVRDFIPVHKGTVGAMYDKRGVGGMNSDGSPRNDGMYFNRGTGNFGYGNDK